MVMTKNFESFIGEMKKKSSKYFRSLKPKKIEGRHIIK